MNGRILFLSTFWSAFLMTSTTALSQSSVSISQQNSSSVSTSKQNSVSITQQSGGGGSQSQEISISLASANLVKRYILRLSAPQGTQVTGQITRNGKVIRQLRGGNQASINLSPLLSKGRQTIRISGSYKPAQSRVRIEFSGPGAQVSQQKSGNGRLNQILTINVR